MPQVQPAPPVLTQGPPAPQPARRPAGPSSAAKPPLPMTRKQRGARLSRFAPQGARPAVQTARVHAELGIPAVLPASAVPLPASAAAEPANLADPSVHASAQGQSAAVSLHGAAQQGTPEIPSSGASAAPGLIDASAGPKAETSAEAVAGDDGGDEVTKPAGWQELLQLAEEASEPPRQLLWQGPPMTPPQVPAYTSQQFDHPGMTPFPGQAVHSPVSPKLDVGTSLVEGSSYTRDRQPESSPQTKLPPPGPPGHTPFPHLPAASSSKSADHESDGDEAQAESPSSHRAEGSPARSSLPEEQAGAQGGVGKSSALPLHMLMQHLQGGSYDSPAANRALKFAADSPPDSSPTTPPAQVSMQP